MAVKPTEKVLGFEEQVAKALEFLVKTMSPKTLSDLDDEEILNLAVLYVWGGQTKCKVLKDFADDFCKLRVSRFRLGRREIVNVASSTAEPERKKLRTIRDLFTGMR